MFDEREQNRYDFAFFFVKGSALYLRVRNKTCLICSTLLLLNSSSFRYTIKQTKYLEVQIDRTYIYWSEMEGGTRVTYTYLEPYQSAGLAWDMWLRQAWKDEGTFLVMENEEGPYIGYPESEYYQVMSYPIMQDATFHSFEETFTTTKIDETITKPAGTFEHVVAVESPDHY
jgi:hypothetical protein